MTSEESKGLWHNIRAKRARGEKPARKGSEAYNKAVAAAKKINATNEEINIQDSDDGMTVSIVEKGEQVGTFELETDDNVHYTIVDANIDQAHRGKGFYQKAIIDLLSKKPNMVIHSVFRSPEAERAWQRLLQKLPTDIKVKKVRYPEEKTTDIMLTKKGSFNEVSVCNKCAVALLEDIKAGKLQLMEAEYQGRTVQLNKPIRTKSGPKKFAVYVKNAKGNVVKVSFGDPGLSIKRDNPERKKAFRARHKCSQKRDKTSPGYWSCKMWSSKPVSNIV